MIVDKKCIRCGKTIKQVWHTTKFCSDCAKQRHIECYTKYNKSEKGKAIKKLYYENHVKSINEYYKEWRKRNLDKISKYSRTSYLKNKNKISRKQKLRTRKFRLLSKEKQLKCMNELSMRLLHDN